MRLLGLFLMLLGVLTFQIFFIRGTPLRRWVVWVAVWTALGVIFLGGLLFFRPG